MGGIGRATIPIPRLSSDTYALLGVCLGFFVILLDATAVNVALGGISESLGGSLTGLQWSLNAYTVVFGGLLLTAGALGDRLGSRRVFLAGVAVFAGASAACAAAPSIELLIAARALQGIGAAAILPTSLSLLADRFPAGPARARALGIWGGVAGVGLAAGPVLGGVLVSTWGWRAVFFAVIPAAAVSAWAVARCVEETPRDVRARPDVAGACLGAIGLVAITAALTESSVAGWVSVPTVALGGAGLAALALLVAVERRSAAPMLPTALFTDRSFNGALLVGALFNFSLYGALFCLALELEQAVGASAATTGLALLPLTVAIAVCALLSGRLTADLGPRVPMLVGLTGAAVGAALLAGPGAHADPWMVAAFGTILGLAGLAMPAMTSVALHAAPARQAALASGGLNASRQMGGALGVALLGSLMGAVGPSSGVAVPMTVVAGSYAAAVLTTALTIPSAVSGRG